MNTIRSTWYGWGALVVGGGGAYYFAKRSVNADRKARHEANMKRRRISESLESLESSSGQSNHKAHHRRAVDNAGSPSTEASDDPAPTKHFPENDGPKDKEKSKYEASVPFRAKKGDRFS